LTFMLVTIGVALYLRQAGGDDAAEAPASRP
jgi:hypothetical protein